MENSDAEVKLLLASVPWLLAAALLNPQGGWAQQPCLALAHVDREVFISCISQADFWRVRHQRHCSAVKQAGEFTWPRAGEVILHGGCSLAVLWHRWEERDVLRHNPIPGWDGVWGVGMGCCSHAGESSASQEHPCQECMMLSRCSLFCSQRQRLTQ